MSGGFDPDSRRSVEMFDPSRSVEVFDPSTGLSCFLPDLPDDRGGHTMDSLYICGGEEATTSCLHFQDGNVLVAVV